MNEDNPLEELKHKVENNLIDPKSYRYALCVALKRACKIALEEDEIIRSRLPYNKLTDDKARINAKLARKAEESLRLQIEYLNKIIGDR